jgi:hypothetical protein
VEVFRAEEEAFGERAEADPEEAAAETRRGEERLRAPAAVMVATREEKARRRAEMVLVAAAAAAALGQRTPPPVAVRAAAAEVDPYPTRAAVARLGAAEEAELARREEHREGRGHRAARLRP